MTAKQIAADSYKRVNEMLHEVQEFYGRPQVMKALPANFASTSNWLEFEARIDQAAGSGNIPQTIALTREFERRAAAYCSGYLFLYVGLE